MRLIKKTITILLSILILTVIVTVKSTAADTVPRRLNYQGRLMDSSDNLLTGTYYICFSIWDNSTVGAGSQVWPASTPTPTSITTSNGVFSAEVGSADTLNIDFDVYDYYLQVYVNTSSSCSSGGETLSPRQHLTSAAYSINADLLDGADAGTAANNVLLLDAQGDINLIDNAIIYGDGMSARDAGGLALYDDGGNGLFVEDGGNVGIGKTSSLTAKLDLLGSGGSGNYVLKILGGNGNVSGGQGDNISIVGGDGFSTNSEGAGAGGDITIQSGAGGGRSNFTSTGGQGGYLKLYAGDSPTGVLSGGNAGTVYISGGKGKTNGNVILAYSDVHLEQIGNVGIGDTSPLALLTVGNGDLFQVNSSGAIAAATGITSSGTITFSGMTVAGFVKNNASGVLSGGNDVALTTDVSGILPIANGGTNSSSFSNSGITYFNGTSIVNSVNATLDSSGNITANSIITNTIDTNFTVGSVVFAGTDGVLSQDNAAFFWDNTNKLLGIGTALPAYTLDIKGQSGSTDFLRVQNNAGDNIIRVSNTQMNVDVPASFNNVGDVEITQDLFFSNMIASTVSSNGALYIEAGDSYEAYDVVLRSKGTGDVVVDDDLLVSSSLYIAGNERFNSSGALIPHTVSATTKFTNLNADLLDGYDSSESSTGSTVAVRNGSGDINSRLFRSEYDTTNATIGYIMTQVDTVSNNYIRPSTPAQVISALGLLTENQTITLSGDVTGSGTTAITTAVVDDSHNHVYSNIDATTSANWAGRITDETGTGLFVLATSPTFTTDIRTPKVIGGTATTSDLYLQTTTGIGTTGADMHFLVGNNGGREAITILNDGSVGIFNTSPTYQLHVYNDGKVTGPGVMIQSEANIASLHFATAALTWATGVYDSSTVGVDDGTYRIGRGIDWATAIDFKIGTGGEVFMPQVYGDYFSTGRDLYISSTGQLGYISSSIRYKENVIDINDVGWLYDLRPVEFDFIADGVHSWGLIAEEVENVQKELVSYNEQGTPETVQYSYLVTPLLKAIQNQNHEIELLKEKQGNVYVYDDSAILVAIEEQKLRIDALEELSPLAQMLELSSEGELVLKAEYKLTVKSDIQVEGNIISANAGHSFIPLMVTENLPIDVQNQERNLTEEELLAFEQVKIENGSIDGNTQIMITATTPLCGNNLYVLGKETNIGFTVTLEKENTCGHDIEFDWWLVKSIDEQKNPS